MTLDELKTHVETALKEQWTDFATRHPHLANAIEETYWIAAAAESIHDDPQFQAAMSNAQSLGTVLDEGPKLVRDFLQRWLGQVR